MTEFAALHCHSSWSFQDSLIKPEPAAARAKEYGYRALSITDHGNIAGLSEHYDACKKHDIIPLLGCEFYIVDDCRLEQNKDKEEKVAKQKNEHITVYAVDSKGIKNLYKLSSISFLEGFYYKPRIDYKTLFKYQEGLIVTSGCLKNRISQAIVKDNEGRPQEDIHLATKIARWMQDNLGDKYYLEMMPHDIPEQVLLNSYLYTISRKLDIPLVVSMDAHYIDHSEAADQDILMAASMHKKEGEEDKRPKLRTATYHLMPIEEIMDLFKKTHPTIPIKAVHKAFENTAKIADMVVDTEEDPLIKYKQDLFPDYCKTPKEGLKLFNDLIEKGWFEKLDAGLIPKDKEELYWDRIKKEKTQIIRTHMENYFLVVWDLIRYAVEKDIPHGVGRGTVGSSMIAWMMGITGVDPIKHKLIFERFINPYRTDLPDIDMDFCYDRRKEITDYIITKYGVDNVCQIATYAKRSTKLALKDVGRALQMDFGVMNWIAKQVEWDEFDTLELAIANSPDAKAMQKKFPNLFEKALKLQGTYRQFGRHPAGVIMSKLPLVEVVPLKNTKEDDEDDSGIKTVAQYDMNVLKKIGLIKLDVLGLRTCTIMADVLRNIKSIYGEDVDLEKLPLEDKPTFEMLTEGDLAGVFQVEKSTGLRRLLIKIGIHKFSEIHDMIALYRPGPLKQGMAEIYIENKAKTMEGEKLRYHEIDAVHEILSTTYGTGLYQEQIMEMLHGAAGLDYGVADTFRKIMDDLKMKGKEEKVAEYKDKFIEGCMKHSKVDHDLAESTWKTIEGYTGYTFNRSHSVEYGLITYWTAYLKCHYFKAFLLSMFNSTDKDIERVKRFVLLARQRGVKIRLPFINEADVRFKYDDKGRIVWSFQDIKGMGESAIPEILEKRPFNSLEDMLKRVTKKNCNKKSIQSLIKAGSFSQWDFDETRNTYNKHYDDTFDKDFQGTFLDLEREALGIHLTESPMTRHIELLQGVRRLSDMEDVPEGSTDLFAGVIDKLSIKKSKKDSSEFAIVEVEDESYTKVPLFVFGKAYNKYRDRLIEGTVLKFQAEKTQDRLKINSDKLLLLNLDRQNNGRG
jgi:DNA polymerase-3 subunit alpha